MKVIDDGVIKYDRSNFTYCPSLDEEEVHSLEYWRKKLYKLNLIGEYPEVNIGFGNMSVIQDYKNHFPSERRQFVITGTQTGKFSDLTGAHYTRVLDYDIENLKIKTMGPIEASSEALTHAAIYMANPAINVIFHIHSTEIWKGMIEDNADFTCESIPYGTVEMAHATQKCVAQKTRGTLCMRGHEDGIVIYGEDFETVGRLTLELNDRYCSPKN